ncbi:hypothetical protein C8034_v009389 [Colletotrichum sidae]|uniref:54S ribosomal protein L40 n=1 Tax=Colletotrichum sidae TaxID=1347389 RepID=A0A4R8TMH6_9PEZI|nr:hypothetical protein C8034_v009389 [Colletotrichum sidae]
MKRLLARTRQAEKQVKRRQSRALRGEIVQEKKARINEQRYQLDELNLDIKTARLVRQEKWTLGPLAPRRDVFPEWGALETNRNTRSTSLKDEDLIERCKWAGTPDFLNLAVNDRVVVLDGPDRGRIDTIASITRQHGTVQLKNLCSVTTSVPEVFRKLKDGTAPTQNVAMDIPISSIRLVHPIVDPETGVARDVIIRKLVHDRVRTAKTIRLRSWDRRVPGANIIIPWPKADKKEEPDEMAADTPREHVLEETYIPRLLEAPMPLEVIDELRNKYSVFRTRHTDEYVAQAERREAEKRSLRNPTAAGSKSSRTAVQEFNRQQRDERRRRGKPSLTPEMLEKIGEVIAKNKAQVLNAAGISEVSSSTDQVVEAAAAAAAAVPPEAPTENRPSPQ